MIQVWKDALVRGDKQVAAPMGFFKVRKIPKRLHKRRLTKQQRAIDAGGQDQTTPSSYWRAINSKTLSSRSGEGGSGTATRTGREETERTNSPFQECQTNMANAAGQAALWLKDPGRSPIPARPTRLPQPPTISPALWIR